MVFPRYLVLVVLLTAGLVVNSCGSASTSLTEPTDTRCSVALSLDPASFGALGGKGTAAVVVGRECQWSASTTGNWLTLSNPTSGQGPGSLAFDAAPNRSLSARSADVVVSGQKATVSQTAATCSLRATASNSTVGPAATDVRIAIATDEFCSWKATSRSPWIALGPVSEGTGSMEIVASVAANTEGQRVGAVDVGGVAVQITQRAAVAQLPCEVAIAPTSGSTGFGGGILTVTVTAPSTCAWTVASETLWITATPARGTGAGSVRIETEPNTGPARSGTVTIGEKPFSVSQAAAPAQPPACAFSLDAPSATVGRVAGSYSVSVTTLPTCTWTVQTAASWVHFPGGSHTGSGSIVLGYDANAGPARSDAITIAGTSFLLSQQSGCSYTIAPTSQNVSAATATVTVNVKTAVGCPWEVQGEPTWIVGAPDASQGTGSTVLTVQANTSLARSSTFTIAGQSFTINQASGLVCTYSISPQSLDVSSSSQTRTITVTTQPNCPVGAAENANWLSITSVGQAPSAIVTLAITQNTSKNDRSTDITITGLNFTQTVQVKQKN